MKALLADMIKNQLSDPAQFGETTGTPTSELDVKSMLLEIKCKFYLGGKQGDIFSI